MGARTPQVGAQPVLAEDVQQLYERRGVRLLAPATFVHAADVQVRVLLAA